MPCGGFGCAEDVLWLDVQVPNVVVVQMCQARCKAMSYLQPGLQTSESILLGLSLQRRHAPAFCIISLESATLCGHIWVGTLCTLPPLWSSLALIPSAIRPQRIAQRFQGLPANPSLPLRKLRFSTCMVGDVSKPLLDCDQQFEWWREYACTGT